MGLGEIWEGKVEVAQFHSCRPQNQALFLSGIDIDLSEWNSPNKVLTQQKLSSQEVLEHIV